MILDETFPGHLVLQIFLQPIVCVGFLRVLIQREGLQRLCHSQERSSIEGERRSREENNGSSISSMKAAVTGSSRFTSSY
jgi:hypothetical protein